MAIEQREVLVPHTLRIPMETWHPVKPGDVLYEAPEYKINLTRSERLLAKVEAAEGDKLRIVYFVVDVPYDIAEGQRSNLGHFESIKLSREEVSASYPRSWTSGKFLRGYQLRVR